MNNRIDDRPYIDELIKILKENPDLPIIHMVEEDIMTGDHTVCRGWLNGVKITYQYQIEEYIYTDEDEIKDELAENYSASLDDVDGDYKKLIESGDIVKCIVVGIGL